MLLPTAPLFSTKFRILEHYTYPTWMSTRLGVQIQCHRISYISCSGELYIGRSKWGLGGHRPSPPPSIYDREPSMTIYVSIPKSFLTVSYIKWIPQQQECLEMKSLFCSKTSSSLVIALIRGHDIKFVGMVENFAHGIVQPPLVYQPESTLDTYPRWYLWGS